MGDMEVCRLWRWSISYEHSRCKHGREEAMGLLLMGE